MGGSLLSKAEVPGSSLLGHLPKEFSLRLTWCPWLVGYYGTRGISRGARKLARTPSLSKKKYGIVWVLLARDLVHFHCLCSDVGMSLIKVLQNIGFGR